MLIRRQSESLVNSTCIYSAQLIFLGISISHVAKFRHVLGRGFMIQRVILIFFKCFSVNQNQLFYMKEQYFKLAILQQKYSLFCMRNCVSYLDWNSSKAYYYFVNHVYTDVWKTK